MARKVITKKNTRQVLAVQKKIDKMKESLKLMTEKLQSLQEAEQEAPAAQ